jgi:hypothetical protein
MWIVIRLVLAAIGFCVRQWRRRRRLKPHTDYNGVPYYLVLHTHKKKITAFSLGMPLRSPSWITMHGESRLDRFFKRIGVANEIETGDPAFDDRVYVTSDHPAVATVLAGSPALRAAIQAALDQDASRVRYDGTTVWLDRFHVRRSHASRLGVLAAVHAASAPLADEPKRWFADRFLWKALLIEGVVWASFGYAIGALIEYIAYREDVYVRPSQVVTTGLAAAGVLFVALLAVIALWMRGSSRGHRIIVESAIVLVLGLPITGIQAVGDSNRALDDAPPVLVTRIIERCEVREHRTRRGRRWNSYHLWFAPAGERAASPSLPAELEVTRTLCDHAQAGGTVELEIGPGRWDIPWYRRIRIGGEVWTAPV